MDNTDDNRVEVNYDDNGRRIEKEIQPEWKNPPSVAKLKQEIRDAEPEFAVHVGNIKKWLSVRDGNIKVDTGKGRSKFQPKLVRKQNEWRYSSLSESLLSSDDMFDVTPTTHLDTDAARDNGIILNKQFNKDIDRVDFIDRYVRTAVDEGVVFLRTGWEFEEEEQEVERPVMIQQLPPEVANRLRQAQQAVQQGGMLLGDFQELQAQAQGMLQLVPDPSGKTEMVKELVTLYNRPTIEVCDYDKVLIDPTCGGDLDKAGLIAYQFQTSKAELALDSKYSNVESIISDSDETLSQEEYEEKVFNYEDDPRKKLTAIEYWGNWDINKDGLLVPIVATYVGSTMIRLEKNPFPDNKPPFIKVVYLPKRNDVYGGEPDAVLIEEHQDIIGAISRGMIDLMGKSANAQQGISANALDPAQKLRFEQGKDYIFNPDVDPSKAFFMATFPEIPRSALEMIQFHEQGAEALTGVRAFTSGQGGNALGSTAAAVKTASDATSKREMGILRRLSFGVVEAGRKIMSMNAVNLDDEEVIRITDEEEVTISRDALAGNFDVRLTISTPEVDQEQAQDLGFMLQTIGPSMDPGLQSVILGKIARLKKMPDLAKRIEEYKPEPDPMEEEIKQLQKDLLEAQVQNERAKGTENQADTLLKNAKAETEQAKAKALNSTADMSDLDYVQKKDGTNEMRSEIAKGADHNRAKEAEDQRAVNAIDDKQVAAALDRDNPLIGSHAPTPTSGGEGKSGKLKPKVFTANNHYQKSVDNLLPGTDTPEENMKDSLVNRRL